MLTPILKVNDLDQAKEIVEYLAEEFREDTFYTQGPQIFVSLKSSPKTHQRMIEHAIEYFQVIKEFK